MRQEAQQLHNRTSRPPNSAVAMIVGPVVGSRSIVERAGQWRSEEWHLGTAARLGQPVSRAQGEATTPVCRPRRPRTGHRRVRPRAVAVGRPILSKTGAGALQGRL